MYDILLKNKDKLIDAYEEAEASGGIEKMERLQKEIEEIWLIINTEFF